MTRPLKRESGYQDEIQPDGDDEEQLLGTSRRSNQREARRRVVDDDETDEEDNEDVPLSRQPTITRERNRKRDESFSSRKLELDGRVPKRTRSKNDDTSALLPPDDEHQKDSRRVRAGDDHECSYSTRSSFKVEEDKTQEAESGKSGRARKRRSGWSMAGEEIARKESIDSVTMSVLPEVSVKTTGFSLAPADMGVIDPMSAFATVVAGDAALQSSRLHLMAQQMGLLPDQIKAAREVYVGNLPPQLEVTQLVDFLNAALLALKGNVLPGPPATKGWKATEGHFAFVEYRTMEEANNGLSLRIGRPKTYPEQLNSVNAAQQGTLPSTSGVTNGILTGVSLGTTVNKDLLGAAFNEASSRLSGTIITSVGAITPPPDAMCMRNLPPPTIFSEDRVNGLYQLRSLYAQAREMLTAFGSLKFFLYYGMPSEDVVKAKILEYKGKRDETDSYGRYPAQQVDTNGVAELKLSEAFADDVLSQPAERSVCFFEYHNPLDSQNLTDETDTLKLAGIRPTLTAAETPLADDELTRLLVLRIMQKLCRPVITKNAEPLPVPTRCLFFGNIVTHEELADDQEYADILEDVRTECRKFGRVISIEMPRSLMGLQGTCAAGDENGEGFVFVEFSTVEEACRARKALNGRRFSGRKVKADFLSEKRHLYRDFSNPKSNVDKSHSTLYHSELSSHVPSMLKQMEELERAGREAARAAATAAANASFSGTGLDMTPLPTMASLIDVPKPNFDEDIDRDEEAMDEDDA